jgi:hypothetical protein
MTGYVIDTYKIIKINGEIKSKTKIHRSSYRTLERKVKRGTKKVNQPLATQVPQDVIPSSDGTIDLPVEGTIDAPPVNIPDDSGV